MRWLDIMLVMGIMGGVMGNSRDLYTSQVAKRPVVEQLDHGSVFKKVGRVYTSLAYGHIHVPIKLQGLALRKKKLLELNVNLQTMDIPEEMEIGARKRMQWMQRWVNKTVHNGDARLSAILEAFQANVTTLDNQRQKRQILVAAGGAIVGGIISSIVSQFRQSVLLDVIDKKQTVISAQVQENLIRINQNTQDLDYLNKTVSTVLRGLQRLVMGGTNLNTQALVLQISYAMTESSRQVDSLTQALEEARSGRFSLGLVDASGLRAALSRLQKEGVKDGRHLGVSNIMDLTHMPTSYVVDFTQQVVHVIVHVPMTRAGTSLQLYEYVDSPVKVQFIQTFPLFVEVSLSNQYLAMSSDETRYMTYSVEELRDCHQLLDKYYCPNLVMFKKARRSCLTALYDNDAATIQKLCPLTITDEVSKATRVDQNTYIVTETKRKDLIVNCAESSDRYAIQGTVRLKVNKGCVASTDMLVISHPNYEPEVVIEGLIVNNPMEIGEWIQEDEVPHFIEAAETLLAHVGQKVPLNLVKGLGTFKKRLADAESSNWVKALWTMTPGSILSSVCTIATTAILVCCGWQLVRGMINRRKKGRGFRELPTQRSNSENEVEMERRIRPPSVAGSKSVPEDSSTGRGNRCGKIYERQSAKN